jgi:hypothetical protein
MKVLEALEILKANAILFDNCTDESASMLEAIIELDNYFKITPTAYAVCKAFSEYFKQIEEDFIEIKYIKDFKNKMNSEHIFYLTRKSKNNHDQTTTVTYICDILEGKIRFHLNILPPYLVTLTSRFYEGLNK